MAEAILRLPEVKRRVGLARSSIYAALARKEFPAQIKLGRTAVGWLETEINDWIEQRVAASRNPQ